MKLLQKIERIESTDPMRYFYKPHSIRLAVDELQILQHPF